MSDQETPSPSAESAGRGEPLLIDARTEPDHYRHWRLHVDGNVATLELDVDEAGGLAPGYELKLNSYDLGVDLELADAIQRLRFEQPQVGAVVITSAKERVFCAGANIRMLGRSTHAHKVAFCKFTNETRCAIEDASAHSGQRYLCAINGTAAGGGYELALATDWIMMVDDGSTAVSLPELPLLGVLPGTGGVTRVTDKRKVRRDRADFFCTVEEGVRGKRAVEWRLVDEVVPSSRFTDAVRERAQSLAARSDRPSAAGQGIALGTIQRELEGDALRYGHVAATLERGARRAQILVHGPTDPAPADPDQLRLQGDAAWCLAVARELDDLVLHLRHNEPEIGTLVLRTRGDLNRVAEHDAFLTEHAGHWLVREVSLYWKRLLKRIDMTSRSMVALVEPGSCFAGMLLELLLAADRGYMLDGVLEDDQEPAAVRLTDSNFGAFPGLNGLTRLESRALDDPDAVARARQHVGRDLDAPSAEEHRLVTFAPDDIDWEDEIRIALEERAGFSPDALTGLEANLRCPGPETMESRIFGRLTAWQNWIFQRPNAVGERGALTLYGTGARAEFDKRRV
jgi:benzoyl-CoA-dihydrodiol lyase